MADATRDVRDAVGEKIRVALADVGSGIFTANAAGRAPFASSLWTNDYLANDAKAETICLFDIGPTSLGTGLTNVRIWQNNDDAVLDIVGIHLISFGKLSVGSGTVGISLDAGTSNIGYLNRTVSLAAGTTTTFSAGSLTSIPKSTAIRLRIGLAGGGSPKISRYSKILAQVRKNDA